MARELVLLTEVPQHRPWCTVRLLRRLVEERRCAYHKLGRRIYFDLADLDEWAEQGRAEQQRPARLQAVRGAGP